jgi:hypothetical protein
MIQGIYHHYNSGKCLKRGRFRDTFLCAINGRLWHIIVTLLMSYNVAYINILLTFDHSARADLFDDAVMPETMTCMYAHLLTLMPFSMCGGQ